MAAAILCHTQLTPLFKAPPKRAEWGLAAGEGGTHGATVCPALASSLGSGARFLAERKQKESE